MKCQALNRELTTKECAHAQTELPKKFCKECDWFEEDKEKPAKIKPSSVPSKYTVYISKGLKYKLIEEAKKHNIQPREYIVKILSEKLIESFK